MRKFLIIAAGTAVALAGCDGGEQEAALNEAGNQVAANEDLPGIGAAKPAQAGGVQVATMEPYGPHLVDSEGRTLYVLEPTQAQQDAAQRAQACTGACLGEWPPMMSQGSPQAGQGVDSSKLSTVSRDGAQQVAYAGFPLYYYRGDRQPGQVSGQHAHDRWGEWYVLSPEGKIVEAGQAPNERALRTGGPNQ